MIRFLPVYSYYGHHGPLFWNGDGRGDDWRLAASWGLKYRIILTQLSTWQTDTYIEWLLRVSSISLG